MIDPGAIPEESCNLFPRICIRSYEHRNNAVIAEERRESVMFAFTEFSRSTRHALCMLMSAVIVAASLSFGAYESQTPLHPGYSVTITQLQ